MEAGEAGGGVKIHHLTIHDLRGEADTYSFADEPQIILYDDNVIQYVGERLEVTYDKHEVSEVKGLGVGKVFIVLRNVSGWYIEVEDLKDDS